MTPNFAFFGTPPFAVRILEELKERDLLPSLIVTAPDKKAGRGMKLSPPAVKVWAEQEGIPYIQPESLKEIPEELQQPFDYFAVAAYGKILSKILIELPKHGTLNVHPSLLPKYRGASPIEGQILNDEKHIGVTIMQIDEELDHGPILIQEETKLPAWPIRKGELTIVLAAEGGRLLAEALTTETTPQEQDHDQATFTGKLQKEDGHIDFSQDAYQNFLKFCAYHPWPGTFFFAGDTRIKITEAIFHNDTFIPTKVIPEGKQKIRYSELTGYTLPPEAPNQ